MHTRPIVITRAKTALWAAMSTTVGVALMFRSFPERITGVVFLFTTVALVLTSLSALAIVSFLGYGLLTIACASRSISALFIPDIEWHGMAILLAVWSMLSYIAFERCYASLVTVRHERADIEVLIRGK